MASALAQKVAIVTGAASGIGAALVKHLANSGAKVLAADVNRDGLATHAATIGCETFAVDVANPKSNQEMVDAAMKRFGRLDLAFLNAGIHGIPFAEQVLFPSVQPCKLESLTVDRYMNARSVNLDGVVAGSIAAAQAMSRGNGGSIIVTTSIAGLVPYTADPVYALTKHGVIGWVRSIAPTLQASGVTIDAVCPSGVTTPMIGLTDEVKIPTLMSTSEVAAAMVETAMEPQTGRTMTLVLGRENLRQEQEFSSIPGFEMP